MAIHDLNGTAVIGRIPGYNSKIDINKAFANELLKGVTFIDLKPNSYKMIDFLANNGSARGFGDIFGDLSKVVTKPGLFQSDNDSAKISKIFKGILTRMKKDFNLSSDFDTKDMLRIVAANDSTFTETFNNDFNQENSTVTAGKQLMGSAFNSASAMADKKGGYVADMVKAAVWAGKATKGMGYTDMMSLAGRAAKGLDGTTGSASVSDIMAGAFFGMNYAAPKQWSGSQYNSSLTLFIKLVAPIGTPECIKRNIMEPIMYLLAAASPQTYAGSMYGFPLLWDVQAHGVTNFRLGGISSMSIIRGSFETTFNYLLQPTVVDVRLSIVPLLTDFAVQTNDNQSDSASIYTQANSKYLGVQNPSDLNRGITNVTGASGNVEPETILTIKL